MSKKLTSKILLGVLAAFLVVAILGGATAYIPEADRAKTIYITGNWTFTGSAGWTSGPGWDTLPDTASGTAVTRTTAKFRCESDSFFITGIGDGDSTHASNTDSFNLRVWLYQSFDGGVTFIKIDSADFKGNSVANGIYTSGAMWAVYGCESYFTYQSQLATLDTTRFALQADGYKGILQP